MRWINSTTRRATFLRLLSPRPREKILDVGAGKGVIASLVYHTGNSEVYALDSDKKTFKNRNDRFVAFLRRSRR
jgi:precorrin-6B methylase 2